MSRFYLAVSEIIFVAGVCVVAFMLFRHPSPAVNAVPVEIKMPDYRSQVYLQKQTNGGFLYLVKHGDGTVERVTSEQLARSLYDAGAVATGSGLLNFSNPVILFWLSIGLLGQVLFTGRMIVQWIASERRGKSVVPPLFWWMSLVGSLLLLAYFLWRRDPIGLLGQAFGSFVYLKNILWILGEARPPAELAAA